MSDKWTYHVGVDYVMIMGPGDDAAEIIVPNVEIAQKIVLAMNACETERPLVDNGTFEITFHYPKKQILVYKKGQLTGAENLMELCNPMMVEDPERGEG